MTADRLDAFSLRRLEKVVAGHRARTGELPTFRDLEAAGFAPELLKRAVRDGHLTELFVTLSNGSVVKGFKFAHPLA